MIDSETIQDTPTPSISTRRESRSFRLLPTRLGGLIFFIICAAVGLSTLLYGTVHQPTVALFQAVAALIVVLWAMEGFMSGVWRINCNMIQLVLAGAILYGLIQIIPFGTLPEMFGVQGIPRTISLNPYSTQLTIVQFISLLIFFAAALAYIDSPKRLRLITYTIIIFGFIYAFFAILQYIISPTKIYGLYEPRFAQPFGSFVNRHNFAALIEMCLALPLGLVFTGAIDREKNLIFWTAIGLMGVALAMSGSRGGLLSLVAMLVFLVFLTSRQNKSGSIVWQIGLALVLIAVIIAGTFFVGGDSTLTRIAETAQSQDPTTSRLQIWQTTWEIIKNNPVFGTGWGAFGVAYTKYDSLNGLERAEQSHNDYLQVLSDAGFFGAILGLLFLYFLFRDGFRRIQSADKFRRGVAIGALAGCFAILVHSLFDFVLHTTAISLMFLVLITLATVNGRTEKEVYTEDDDIPIRPQKTKANVTSIHSKRKKSLKPSSE
jgi:O-antigen ligase